MDSREVTPVYRCMFSRVSVKKWKLPRSRVKKTATNKNVTIQNEISWHNTSNKIAKRQSRVNFLDDVIVLHVCISALCMTGHLILPFSAMPTVHRLTAPRLQCESGMFTFCF